MTVEFIYKFTKFGLIGGFLFLFDASLFWLLLKLLSNTPELARVISVSFAMLLSWWLNRTFTFKVDKQYRSWSELIKFVISQLPGAGINALVSIVSFHYFSLALNNPWISVAFGSCAGLLVNFLMAQFFVFRSTHARN